MMSWTYACFLRFGLLSPDAFHSATHKTLDCSYGYMLHPLLKYLMQCKESLKHSYIIGVCKASVKIRKFLLHHWSRCSPKRLILHCYNQCLVRVRDSVFPPKLEGRHSATNVFFSNESCFCVNFVAGVEITWRNRGQRFPNKRHENSFRSVIV